MDIETTPKSRIDENSGDSRLSSLGRRHTPTARMSERKRNLFDRKNTALAQIIDDDVDLGPMSPLQYSSSPTEDPGHLVPFDRSAKQTDFTNLFPGSIKTIACLSPIGSLNSPLFSSEKAQLLVDESGSSTAISVQSLPKIPQPLLTTTTDHSSAIAICNISEVINKPNLVQEKTPSERMINCQELRVSFKKSLILGDMITTPSDDDQRGLKHQKRSYSTSVLTEKNVSSHSVSPREKMAKLDLSDASRARTSLTFEAVSIPTKRFYSSGKGDENEMPSVRSKRFSMPNMSTNKSQNKNHKGHPSSSSHRRSHGVAKKSCTHNIKKPIRTHSKESLKKKVELTVKEENNPGKKEVITIKQEVVDTMDTSRLQDIYKNIKNPLEMSRPLFFKEGDDRFDVSDEELPPEETEKTKKKFFKSGTTGAKSYKLTNNVVATVEGGRITLPQIGPKISPNTSFNSQPDVEFSMMEDEFGSEEVTDIISKLTSDEEMDEFRNRIPYETTDPVVIQRQKDMLEILIANQLCNEKNFEIFIAKPEENKEEMNRILDSLVVPVVVGTKETNEEKEKEKSNLFPIFHKQQSKKKLVALAGLEKASQSRKVWKRIGDTQLQIDAGQKRFGATYCAECDLLYSVHEPEDERMHDRFHASLSVLKFNGWKQENLVWEVARWGLGGRVIAVPWNEHRSRLLRVNVVLDVINKEMGCPSVDWKSKMIVYLAMANNTILGVCVAESKYEANRLSTEGGMDYFSEENYPVWCGISRIWVAAPYRNQGVGTELVNAVRANFTIGRTLGIDEVAFQSPTEAGKLLGQKLTGRRDFLVYP